MDSVGNRVEVELAVDIYDEATRVDRLLGIPALRSRKWFRFVVARHLSPVDQHEPNGVGKRGLAAYLSCVAISHDSLPPATSTGHRRLVVQAARKHQGAPFLVAVCVVSDTEPG